MAYPLFICFVITNLVVISLGAQTELFIVNLSKSDIRNTVVIVSDDSDWANGSGPHHNFLGVQIPSGQAVRGIEYVNDYAENCPFTMFLEFADGSKEEFKVNQKFAIGQAPHDFQHLQGSRKFTYESIDRNVLMITVKD